ncbi:hypothetical protein [Amycolatopsis sp. EV170708-02-1]|uniref:hypothetical protein n=1 Tax=Amycolatopsis sp. EV170708-02-1 TaxID=2919322 RepID=UPI001F0C706A|nr:hypothetical protein [Amycolatopsis sp. EV170708-02-1]UMP06001.1 hypothetical protein MJQ72_14815 [Amycolatopsis sp. EV170708-02-1]
MGKALRWAAVFALVTAAGFGTAAAQASPSEGTGAVVSRQQVLEAEGDRTALAPGTAHGGRVLYCGIKGLRNLWLPIGGVRPGHGVVLSVAESGSGGVEFIGNAVMNIQSTAVQTDGVLFQVDVQWDSGLCIWVKYVAVL